MTNLFNFKTNLSGQNIFYCIFFAKQKLQSNNWVDVFTREIYLSILTESLTYCRKHKGMELYAYVFMPNHVHLLFRSLNEDPSGLMRDFKGFTSRKLIQAIKENPRESRKEYLLKQFKDAGSKASNVTNYQFWQQNNKPIEVYSEWVVDQKMNYIRSPLRTIN